MRLHDIQDDDLPYKIRMSLEKYKKTLNKNSVHNIENNRAVNKSLSTGRKAIKQNIDNQISHVAVTGGDMITFRNKNKQVKNKNLKDDSLIEDISSQSKSNTRNKDKQTSSKNNLSTSNGGDSIKALDDLIAGAAMKKANNQNYVLKKSKITFKPIRNRIKNKATRGDNQNSGRDVSADYKSMPQKISESTESHLGN